MSILKKTILVLLGVLFTFTIGGCVKSIITPQAQLGSLKLAISVQAPKTILPGFDMWISSYEITGSGPDGAAFERVVTSIPNGNDYETFENLKIGSWTIQVNAKNGAGTLIATGTTIALVHAGDGSTAQVTLNVLEGIGTLNINLSWPSGFINNPVVNGTIDGSPITFTVNAQANTASYNNTEITTGYHLVVVTLYDGTVEQKTLVEAVRIVKDQPTTWNISLETSDFTSDSSDFVLIITPEIDDPMEIYFKGFNPILQYGNNMTVKAITKGIHNVYDYIQPDSYQWYLDGKPLDGETLATVSVGSGLTVGKHTLTVVVRKDDVICSRTNDFNVSSGITTLYYNDFEGANQVTPSGVWSLTTSDYHSLNHCWTDSPDGPYQGDSDTYITLPQIDLNGKKAVLSFWHKHDIAGYWNSGTVQFSTDGGNNWGYYSEVCEFSGNSDGWIQSFIDLSMVYSNSIMIRFHLDIDGFNFANADGWYIDDVHVYY